MAPSLLFLYFILPTLASVTVHYQQGQTPIPTLASGSAGPSYTGSPAFNPGGLLTPPPIPGGDAFPGSFSVSVGWNVPSGASITQKGSFVGFSIEMSVVNQVLGKNASVLQVPFLNLMAGLQRHSGEVLIRVGGNTQETAVLVDQTPDGRILEKDLSGVSNPTQTPPLIFTPELLYMMRNISSLVNVRWFLGIPFNDSTNWRLGIVEKGQQILGDYLVGLQAGNEPDLYASHGHRPATYGPYDYFGEFGSLIQAMNANGNIPNKQMLIAPNLASGDWTPEMVWNTGFVDAYNANLGYLAVEHYPTDNCFAQFGLGTPRSPQAVFPNFLNHTAPQTLVAPYLNSTMYAQGKGKKMLMFETNTASCGGFLGVSDSFGAALWGVDYALQMAWGNFSAGLFHVGGQGVYYNPFTAPQTNQSIYRQWSIGPLYYSALVVAETLGGSGNAQVVDLLPNSANVYTPGYAIYESGVLGRVVLMNYVSGGDGVSISVDVALGSGQGSGDVQVKVKFLLAENVSQKGNFTWGGQTFGSTFSSDGRLMGTESVQTIACSLTPQQQNRCTLTLTLPSPSLAVLFFPFPSSPSAYSDAGPGASPTTTFPTTIRTRRGGTASVDPSVLATSNGHGGRGGWSSRGERGFGSTSRGSVVGGARGNLERSSIGIGRVAGILVITGVVMNIPGL